MLIPVARAGALMEIQRIRRSKIPGEVLVYEGQQVLPEDVIVQTSTPAEVVMVEIAQSLGVEMMAVKEFLVRESGEYLFEGDMLAQISGTLPRLVRAPVTGRFTGLHQGKAVFEVGLRTLQVKAGLAGVVRAVLPEFGALVSTSGFLLQGMWGNGAIGAGELRVIKEAWRSPLVPGMLPERGEGAVLAAGSCVDEEALTWFGTRSSGGIILGLLAPGLIKIAREMTIPIIVLQGFGSGQPDSSLLEWLTPLAGQPVSLNAGEADRLTGMRPEAVIHVEGEFKGRALSVREALRVGQQVRVFIESAWGVTGEVLAIPEGLTPFESGAAYPAATIQFPDGKTMAVPQQNLTIQDQVDIE